jgi:hypothetical protein
VAVLLLKLKHHRGDFIRLDRSANPLLTDLPVLAKHAAQITPAEKDRTRSMPTSKNAFFAMVGTKAVHHGPLPSSAYRSVDGYEAIDMAIAGA